jgi:hypothetical protein
LNEPESGLKYLLLRGVPEVRKVLRQHPHSLWFRRKETLFALNPHNSWKGKKLNENRNGNV